MGKSVTSPTSTGQQSGTQATSEANTHPKYKKVFIQRDYSHGTAVKFLTEFPTDLEGYVEPELFNYVVETVNYFYQQGEEMSSRVFCESCCACFTAYLAYICMDSFYDKCAKKVSDFIEDQNDLKWKPRGLLLTDPIERGLRVIEITIFLDKAQQRQPASISGHVTMGQNQNHGRNEHRRSHRHHSHEPNTKAK
ncbi:Golgin subfamily A member 7 [Halotydeus destructor]|nr:Golgin subfamily A member 7 [Halotydeus destructor]